MSTYREYRYYSLARDADVVRLSMTDAQGREYYTTIPALDGRAWRERRDDALTGLDQAIIDKMAPGEIILA